MKVQAITIRAGNVIDDNGKLWIVVKSEIMQPGKGAAVVQVEMRDIMSGTKTNVRYRTQETVERARVDDLEYQFLFATGDDCTFMNVENFEQINITKELIGDQAVYLQENMVVSVQMHEGKALSVTLPEHVTMKIVEADPVTKGQTASSSYKPAILENGARVLVPPYIGSGEKIVVRTSDSTFFERAKD